jgi:hypothetical protein
MAIFRMKRDYKHQWEEMLGVYLANPRGIEGSYRIARYFIKGRYREIENGSMRKLGNIVQALFYVFIILFIAMAILRMVARLQA